MNIQDDKYRILKDYFGHSSFRNGQEDIIDNLCSNKDVLCIMPTGAGKSMCYQIPALMFEGITIVISPLISLMQDQVHSLIQSGISAAYINSSLSIGQYRKVLYYMSQYKYKIIYAAPERLDSEAFVEQCKNLNISMIAVDEAHCVSHWGQDFRPSYLKIPDFIKKLSIRPVVGAFTATATKEVKQDISDKLCLIDPFSITTGFNRPNLYFSVLTPSSKEDRLLGLLEQRKSLSGIVYCSTRSTVEKLCICLNDNGFSATQYHAGLPEEERKQNQEDFCFDKKMIMVATNAFGMGIDKSNVSYIIHYNMPKNLESYYQEAGRAGRDGGEAECILMYSPSDVRTIKFFISKIDENPDLSEEDIAELKSREEMRLKYMTFYCTTNDCLRAFMLRYFGEITENYCGKCSNCLTNYETADITVESQKILSCIVRMNQNYGIKMVCDVLRGSSNTRIENLNFNSLSTYGIMKDCTENYIRTIINSLIINKCIILSEGEYPVLKLGKGAAAILKGEKQVYTKLRKQNQNEIIKKHTDNTIVDNELFTYLKSVRKEIAERASVPAYVVFTDASLKDMCRIKPENIKEFSQVTGVGRMKLDKYGKTFIEAIKEFEDQKRT